MKNKLFGCILSGLLAVGLSACGNAANPSVGASSTEVSVFGASGPSIVDYYGYGYSFSGYAGKLDYPGVVVQTADASTEANDITFTAEVSNSDKKYVKVLDVIPYIPWTKGGNNYKTYILKLQGGTYTGTGTIYLTATDGNGKTSVRAATFSNVGQGEGGEGGPKCPPKFPNCGK